ncbi:hypothetical protein [Hoeflea sp.]|uniref:hypothetical protein n=1 Tax=Hoeflea sp. TaxID=1940281 RepID=UPI003BB078E1
MNRLISRLTRSIDATFGTCSICMRKSFLAALAASGLWLAATLLWPDLPVPQIAGLAALGLVALWLMHVATYAARAVHIARRKRRQTMPEVASGPLAVLPGAGLDRRAALGVFARALGVAVFASATVWPFSASASQHVCGDGSRCEIGNKCCWNSTSETYFCCAGSHVCCVDGYSSYCRNPNMGEHC